MRLMNKEGNLKTVDESPSKRIIDIINKQYRENLSKIVRRGMKIRAERGWAPYVPPLGYLNDPVTKSIIPDPDTWGRVRILLETAANRKLNIPALAKFARYELALKCKNGQPLNSEALRRMMANPFYAGRFWYGGKLYEGKHQAMITKEQFDCLQEVLKTTKRTK